MKRPPPERRYAIHFTPRSGSSWLTDIAEQSGVLGSPRECFNPNFMPEMVCALGALGLTEYIDVLGRRFQAEGNWGFEITHYQLEHVFENAAEFHAHLGDVRHIWLVREDIVAQAVSLQKLDVVGVAHSVNMSAGERTSAEARFDYDAEAIGKWLLHLQRLENITEQYFDDFGITPLRLSYERMISHGSDDVVAALLRFIGSDASAGDISPRHEKIGTSRNLEFAKRFREENSEFCAEVAEDRRRIRGKLIRDLTEVEQIG